MRIILIIKEDIKFFPPAITIINSLMALHHKVIVIGDYSDTIQKIELIEKGVVFLDTGIYDVDGSPIKKLLQNYQYRRKVKQIIKNLNLHSKKERYYLWIFQNKTICLLYKLVHGYSTILHPLEFSINKVKMGYKLLSPRFKVMQTYRAAKKVVCCEYNRAQILRGVFGLDRLPSVLPNKMLVEEDKIQNAPMDILQQIEQVKRRVKGKKVILYQGIFYKNERRLDEFCKAIQFLGDQYVFLIMGKRRPESVLLEKKFSSDRIIFIDFIRPPYHLLITRLADIGVLTYFPQSENISSVINPLYCAPNKIFEYGYFGIPMIGNDIPGLHYIFKEFHCGETVPFPLDDVEIATGIKKILYNYNFYSEGARDYYDSVKINEIISEIIS